MKTQMMILVFGVLASTASFANEYRSACEQETGLPECGPATPRGVHCCVDYSNIPNVQCGGNWIPVRGNDGRWTCTRIPSGGR